MYGVSIMNVVEKIKCVINGLNCIFLIDNLAFGSELWGAFNSYFFLKLIDSNVIFSAVASIKGIKTLNSQKMPHTSPVRVSYGASFANMKVDRLVFFSAATGMKWIKAKMEELGVSSNTNYKLTFMLDDLAMITVHTPKYGVIDVSWAGGVESVVDSSL